LCELESVSTKTQQTKEKVEELLDSSSVISIEQKWQEFQDAFFAMIRKKVERIGLSLQRYAVQENNSGQLPSEPHVQQVLDELEAVSTKTQQTKENVEALLDSLPVISTEQKWQEFQDSLVAMNRKIVERIGLSLQSYAVQENYPLIAEDELNVGRSNQKILEW